MARESARVTKDPVERKNELIDIAEQYFARNGYEETSVNDIIMAADVAKGTFYYYFKSKEDLMIAVIDRQLEQFESESRKICADPSLDARKKIQLFINHMIQFKDSKGNFLTFLYSEKNYLLRQRYFEKMNRLLGPYLLAVVEQGIREGVLDIPYPRETVDLLILMPGLFVNYLGPEDSPEQFYRKMRALESAFERLLGAQKGSISLML